LPVGFYRATLGPDAALSDPECRAGSAMSAERWISTFNATNWRISTFNGALLAAYFVPTWAIVACKIMISPIGGFYERPNISLALYASDYLHVAETGMARVALLLALGKLTVVAFSRCFSRSSPASRFVKAAAAMKRWESRSASAA
jgi:hypothetical protein